MFCIIFYFHSTNITHLFLFPSLEFIRRSHLCTEERYSISWKAQVFLIFLMLNYIIYMRILVRDLGLTFLLSTVLNLFHPTSQSIVSIYTLFFPCCASSPDHLNYLLYYSFISSLQILCFDTNPKSNRTC